MSKLFRTPSARLRKFWPLFALYAFGLLGACEQDEPQSRVEGARAEVLEVRWADDFEAAQREALESSKPIFVAFNTMALGNPQSPDL